MNRLDTWGTRKGLGLPFARRDESKRRYMS